MYVSESISVNEKGHLTMNGADTVELAAEFGTPLLVYSEDGIRANCRKFVNSIKDNYAGKGRVLYASKAFCCKELCRIAADEGMGLDVVSGGELFTALAAGFPVDKIYFHGNNKTAEELKYALSVGVGRIIVDNKDELNYICALAGSLGKTAKIFLRIKPGIDAHTHAFIKTGQIDSKFGFALETGEAMAAVELCFATKNVELCGLHCHIGSQIFDITPFEHAAEVMIRFIADIKKKTGVELHELNLGGGFGIKYKLCDSPEDFSLYMKKVADSVKKTSERYNVETPFILLEPGRSIVGAEGLTLYRVGGVKQIPDVRTYVSVDGGMGDNPRYILYQAEYEAVCANKASLPRTKTVTIAGKCCESGDLIQEHTLLQEVEPGDLLAILSTGAYCYSMASNYNRIPRPAVVMIKDAKARIIIRRERYEDLTINDV